MVKAARHLENVSLLGIIALDMGADGIFAGGGVDPQNRAAAAASIGAAAATFDPGGGGGVDTTERIS